MGYELLLAVLSALIVELTMIAARTIAKAVKASAHSSCRQCQTPVALNQPAAKSGKASNRRVIYPRHVSHFGRDVVISEPRKESLRRVFPEAFPRSFSPERDPLAA